MSLRFSKQTLKENQSGKSFLYLCIPDLLYKYSWSPNHSLSMSNRFSINCLCPQICFSLAWVRIFQINLYFSPGFLFGSLLSLWSHILFQNRNRLESYSLWKCNTLQKLFLVGACSFFKCTSSLHWFRNSPYLITNSLATGLPSICFERLRYSQKPPLKDDDDGR